MTSDILIYQNIDGFIKIDVRLETVWLARAQIGQMFGKDKRNIGEHISNIYIEGKLQISSTDRKFGTVPIEVGYPKFRYSINNRLIR